MGYITEFDRVVFPQVRQGIFYPKIIHRNYKVPTN
jgi:hypothetical protein